MPKPIPAHRFLLILLGLIFVSTLPFWLWPLDVSVSAFFYHPELGAGDAAWPVQNLPFVQFCYKAAPILTMLIALPALFIVLFGGWIKKLASWRAHAGVVVLTVVLGPGLLVNGVFKEFWDRPRPVQTVDFGGDYPYAPPLVIGQAAGGKSFPCGHCSAGFALAALWLVLRRRRPMLARAALGLALLLGASMGFSRIAAGGHYLSDVLWAAWLPFFAVWLSYYLVLRIPQREAGWSPAPLQLSHPLRWLVGGVVFSGVVFGALMATPADLHWSQRLEGDVPTTIRIERANPQLWLTQSHEQTRIEVDATWQGFGLPGGRVRVKHADGLWVITPRGVFSELRDTVLIHANLTAGGVLRLELDSAARLSVHCAPGASLRMVQSNLPVEQVDARGCR